MHDERVDAVGQALGYEEDLPVGAEGQGCRTRSIGAQESDGVGNQFQLSMVVKLETDYAAAATGVENVNQMSILGHSIRLAATREGCFRERQVRAVNSKYRDLPAACVDCKKQRVILAQGKGALRFQRVVIAAATTAAGRESAIFLQ